MPSFAPPLHLASFAANSSSALKLAQVHNRKPNKAAELALAVDGEGLWRYDVRPIPFPRPLVDRERARCCSLC